MGRAGAWLLILGMLAGAAVAQASPQGELPQAPSTLSQPAQPVAPPAKTPPQAKTQEEYNAFLQMEKITDPAAAEKAADDFAAKFPESELRALFYYRVMTLYQAARNREKTIAMGRKVVALNPNEPVTLATLAEVLGESVSETDPQRDLHLREVVTFAQRALQTVDTDLLFPPNASPQVIAGNRNLIRSIAYEALALANMARDEETQAEANLKQAIELNTVDPDPVTWLRYAIVLDHLRRYPEALTSANRALELSPAGSAQASMATSERDRLLKLTGAAGAAPAAKAK
jgi:tetratricopeptide (TPR) repeat protein